MEKPRSYCEAVETMGNDNVHRIYHDTQYGYPIHDDNELFGRLILEINQAGLSWTTILNKQQNFRKAFHNFKISKVASYGDKDRDRLLSDAGIIRNRLKIDAAIHNARVIISLQKEYGSFKSWLDGNHPLTKDEWVRLFKKHFRFTGGEIVSEFLMSTGYLPGAHIESCAVFRKIAKLKPPFARTSGKK